MADEALGYSRIHLIGAGGKGMSSIALVLHQRGFAVTGSDLKSSKTVRELIAAGVPVTIGHDAEAIDRADPEVVVVSTAVPEDNVELRRARELGIPVWPRARMLDFLSRDSVNIAVAGTHGKTTTSSMIAVMLDKMGLDPSFIIGGDVVDFGTNGRSGSSSYLVAEADESDESFLSLNPTVAMVTNVEADHLDHYGSLEDVRAAFRRFIALAGEREGGCCVCCGEDPALVELAMGTGVPTTTYGRDEALDVVCRPMADGVAEVAVKGGPTVTVTIRHNPGDHNLVNATGAIACAWVLGLDVEAAAKALSEFKGVRRRFTLMGVEKGVTVMDDFAHHPTEIRATLEAASKLVPGTYKRLVLCFQPHRYSRTQKLARDFADVFDKVDELIVTDIFPAWEEPIPGISGRTIVRVVREHNPELPITYVPERMQIVNTVAEHVRPGDMVMTMGCGDIVIFCEPILERLRADAAAEAAAAALEEADDGRSAPEPSTTPGA